MSPNQLFAIVNPIAAGTWILLALFPSRRWVTHLVAGAAVPALLAAAYAAIIGATFFGAPGGFSSLPEVAALFSNPWLLLAGWIHYLAFDLLVGAWEVRDSRERRVPHLLVLPCLVLTFLFGPAGWLLYMAVRSLRTGGPVR
jgi:Domain of unknown function (DUF4281)